MTFAPPRRSPSLMFPADVRREIGGHLLSAGEVMKREVILMRLHEAIQQGRRDIPEQPSIETMESPSAKAVQAGPDHFRSALRSLLALMSRQASMGALGEKLVSEIIACCQGARGHDRHVDGYLKELASRLLREREKSPSEEKLKPVSPMIRPGLKSRKELPSSPKLRLGQELCDELWGLPRPMGAVNAPNVAIERTRVEGPLMVHRGRVADSSRSLKGRSQGAVRVASVTSKSVESHGEGGGQCPAWMAHPVKYREARVEEVRRIWAKQEREAAHVREKQRRERRYEELLCAEHASTPSPEVSVMATRRSQSARSLRMSGRSLSPASVKRTLEPSCSACSPVFATSMASMMASQRSLLTTSSVISDRAEMLASVRPISQRGPFVPREATIVRRALSSVYDHCASRLFVESMARSYRPKCSGKSLCSKSRQKEASNSSGLPLGAEISSAEKDDNVEQIDDSVAEAQGVEPKTEISSSSEQQSRPASAFVGSFGNEEHVGSGRVSEIVSAIESRQASLTVESMRRKSKRIISRAISSIDERSQRSAWDSVIEDASGEMPEGQEENKFTLSQSVSDVIRRSNLKADPTLTMSASQLYQRYISKNDDDTPNLTDRQMAIDYVETLIRRVTRPSASSARQRRILGGSGYYTRSRW